MSFKINNLVLSEVATPISDVFISKYMPEANHTFSVIYIHTLSLCVKGNPPKNNLEISNSLNLLESDIIRAWQYWAKKGIINYDELNNIVEFIPLTQDDSVMIKSKSTPNLSPVLERRIDYSPEELSLYTQNSQQVRQLFESAQSYLSKLLTHQDLSIIFSFYDWYRLPMEVIEILFAYCTSKGHYKLSYIESVARDWSEKNIDSVQKANEYITQMENFSSEMRKIMKAFGQGNREPVKFESDIIKKWLSYNMPIEVIEKACERTINNTGKCNFQYCDTIISKWKDIGIKSIEDIIAADEKYYNEKQAKSEQKTQENRISPKPISQPKTNRFVNYEQRNWDFDELKRLEREYVKRRLEE